MIVGPAALAVIAALAVPQVRERVFSFGSSDAGWVARGEALANYPKQMAGHWLFGLGWGRPEFKDPAKAFEVNYVANAPLLTVYRGGVISGLLFVVMLVVGCVVAYRALRSDRTSSAFLGAVFISCCVIAFQLDFPTVTIAPVTMMLSVFLAFLTYIGTYGDRTDKPARGAMQYQPRSLIRARQPNYPP